MRRSGCLHRLRDTGRAMSEESTTPDLVEIVRRANDAFNRRDVDAWMSFYSPDIVYRPVPSFPDSQERQRLAAMRRWMEVYRFRDAKIASVQDFTDRAGALKAAGLEE
jgi:ketosteroid isomerase-like protein